MAIITVSTNSNYSAIKGSLANGDTIRIDTNTVRLTIDEQPLLTNITVDSPGVSGRCTINDAYDLSTWSFEAGTVSLVDGSVPAGCTIGSATGGSVSSAFGVTTNNGTITTSNGGSVGGTHGVATNNGTVTTATGGSSNNAHGINNNNGTVTTATGGSSGSAFGVATNNGTVTTATGGSVSGAHGIFNNNGTVTTATGGSVSGAHGVANNNGTVTTATGGSVSNAFGIFNNNGTCLQAFNNTARAINISRGDFKLVDGPNFQTTIDQTLDTITTIYTINGPLHPSAVIPAGVTVIELTTGTGGGAESISAWVQ
jgi:hypothetical protein